MDLSSLTGGKSPAQEQKPAFEYTAQAATLMGKDEAKLTIGEDALTVATLFHTSEIPYSMILGISFDSAFYTVYIKSTEGDTELSRMGNWAQPFYNALCDAYNKAVLRSLFVGGNPILTAKGNYKSIGDGFSFGGSAPLQVYENCVVSLPADYKARRVPLCFVVGMDKGDYELTLRLDSGDSYTYAKLGYDTVPFANAVEKQIRKLREKSLAAIKEIAPALPSNAASQIAAMMPEGAAAPIGQLAAISPAFVAALEEKLFTTRAAESYKAFKELCDPAQIYVGFRKNEVATSDGIGGILGNMTGGGNPLEALGNLAGALAPQDGDDSETVAPMPYLLWLIAPSPDGKYAAVEFAEADAATYIYRTDGYFNAFARRLNCALEAISFKREVIRFTDDDLFKPENARYFMADQRTWALQYVRVRYVGRVIHSSPEAWKRKLTELWSGTQSAEPQAAPAQTGAKFCGQCGAPLASGVKFCGDCGERII